MSKGTPRINIRLNKKAGDKLVVDFLPDADEIERSPLPKITTWTLRALAGAMLLFVVWASVSEIDQTVTARGKLVNPLPNIVVQPLETSIIQSIDVRIGQIVRKGDRLAMLDPTFTQADETQLRTRLNSLENQTRSLQAELSGGGARAAGGDADAQLQARLSDERQGNLRAQQARMNETVAKLRASLETNQKDQVSLNQRVRSLREIETMQEKLVAQQYGARVKLLEAQEKRLEAERELLLTQNREQEIRRDLAAFQAEKTAFDKNWRQKAMEDLLAVSRERDSIAEQLAKANKRRNMVNLIAPVDGVILDIAKLSPGSIVKEAESFFTIVPLNGALEAEVQINSMDVGYVKAGDLAHLKLDAFPYQKHGSLDAKVRTISEDSFSRQQGEQGADAYYVTRIAFGDAKLKKMNKARMLPGMTVSAEILVGKRTVMSYLLWPLTKALDESIREP
jgi:HlyD family secretion protein